MLLSWGTWPNEEEVEVYQQVAGCDLGEALIYWETVQRKCVFLRLRRKNDCTHTDIGNELGGDGEGGGGGEGSSRYICQEQASTT